jgi:hypothetical protein
VKFDPIDDGCQNLVKSLIKCMVRVLDSDGCMQPPGGADGSDMKLTFGGMIRLIIDVPALSKYDPISVM